ncbi:hypothetical protein PAUR_a1456 [Pseudoalteromonas aurantia 208]|uniref:Orphan protein n=1 Tax=Pseudoalteromonas aurantia 208 TaxID=1314867 RepID=A0ABR9ECL6_9GAMM|nr:hypothetical protein [Pseudoalteromonas aurantia 208]
MMYVILFFIRQVISMRFMEINAHYKESIFNMIAVGFSILNRSSG